MLYENLQRDAVERYAHIRDELLSYINALLGVEILPTAVVPLTSIPTVLVYFRM